MAFICKLIETALGVTTLKRGMGAENPIFNEFKRYDCFQTTTNEKLIYFPINSCKLQKHLGSSNIQSLKSALLGKIHALSQDVLFRQTGLGKQWRPRSDCSS